MNRQLLDILNQQEQADQNAYQSEALLIDMIRKDFADSEMLSGSDAAIAEIAEDLGYANASGLHKQFYAAYGITPSAYRKIYGQGNWPLRK